MNQMALPTYTPGRHRWLQALADKPGTRRRGVAVIAIGCMNAGWTKWHKADKPGAGEALTGSGAETLKRWSKGEAVREYVGRPWTEKELLTTIEKNLWALQYSLGKWHVIARLGAVGTETIARGPTVREAIRLAIEYAQREGIEEPEAEPEPEPKPVSRGTAQRVARRQLEQVTAPAENLPTYPPTEPSKKAGPPEGAFTYSAPLVTVMGPPRDPGIAPGATFGARLVLSGFLTCELCNGKGWKVGDYACHRCKGNGKVARG